MFSNTTSVFEANYTATEPLVINQGGTSSGKTYAILQVLALRALTTPNIVVTVVGQDIPNLKKGALRDFQKIVSSEEILQRNIVSYNFTDRVYTFGNGSVIEFNSYDDAQDAKNGKRNYLFGNEANGIPYDVWENLYVRTSTQSFIDYNPTGEFWVHSHIFPHFEPGYKLIHSTYAQNPFVAERVQQQLMHYKKTDPWRWEVYGLGHLALQEGLVYPHWQITDRLPEGGDEFYGLDFGFNDPAALVKIVHKDKVNYVQELIYQPGLTTTDLIAAMKDLIPARNRCMIYADSAEPDRILEMKRAGFNVVKAQKEISVGIDAVKSFKLFVTQSSVDLINEIKNYAWLPDPKHSRKYLDEPVKFNDHLMDALRYAIHTHLKNTQRTVITHIRRIG